MVAVLIAYYTRNGATAELARAVSEGVDTIPGVQSAIRRVPPLASLLAGASVSDDGEHLYSLNVLRDYDAVVFGTPSRFGGAASELRYLFDGSSALWREHALAGKVGSVIVASGSQHGGHEAAALDVIVSMLHHGMLVVGVPYTCGDLKTMAEIAGGSPYGAGRVTGPAGDRPLTAAERAVAHAHGRRVAVTAARLKFECKY
ncbi:MAG: NAD(P)H:quinone oxidoreductase [Rhodovibrio sp.]|nr:NAD(P)H:quinone oxidoreductase [Rhodovibrio sp.]